MGFNSAFKGLNKWHQLRAVALFIPILPNYLITALAVWAFIGPVTANLIWGSTTFCWLFKEKCCGERLDVGQMMEGLCDTFRIPCVERMRWPSTLPSHVHGGDGFVGNVVCCVTCQGARVQKKVTFQRTVESFRICRRFR